MFQIRSIRIATHVFQMTRHAPESDSRLVMDGEGGAGGGAYFCQTRTHEERIAKRSDYECAEVCFRPRKPLNSTITQHIAPELDHL